MITVFSGGTGTPKLLQGLKDLYNPSDMNIVVNTLENDYFSGVYVSADIDTVLYTMSDMINEEFWYGVKGDTFITHNRLEELGCPELLKIGDIDRSTKIQKTLLMENHTLAEAVNIQSNKMGITSKIIPMSNENSDIEIITNIGKVEFHDFLIKYHSQLDVFDIKYSNVLPCEGIIESIENSDGVIIGPSNPITSILPIINLKGVKKALKNTYTIAISPIIGNKPISGPASKFMNALNIDVSSIGIASLYSDFLDNIVIDNKDISLKEDLEEIINEVTVTNTFMKNYSDKKNLAQLVLNKIFS